MPTDSGAHVLEWAMKCQRQEFKPSGGKMTGTALHIRSLVRETVEKAPRFRNGVEVPPHQPNASDDPPPPPPDRRSADVEDPRTVAVSLSQMIEMSKGSNARLVAVMV